MDPISLILTALATGAAAGLKPAAERAVTDAYEGLRTIIRNRYTRVNESLTALEAQPSSAARKAAVEEDLAEEEAAADTEVLEMAKKLLEAVSNFAPEAAREAAVDIEDVRVGASLNIEDIVADGAALRIRRTDVADDLNIRGIRGGSSSGSVPGS
jgi:hypothetical protein